MAFACHEVEVQVSIYHVAEKDRKQISKQINVARFEIPFLSLAGHHRNAGDVQDIRETSV